MIETEARFKFRNKIVPDPTINERTPLTHLVFLLCKHVAR